jgi:hypothetical protein
MNDNVEDEVALPGTESLSGEVLLEVFKQTVGGDGCPDWAKVGEKGSKMTLDQLKRIAPLVSVSKSYGKMELVKKICEALNQRGIVEKCAASRRTRTPSRAS